MTLFLMPMTGSSEVMEVMEDDWRTEERLPDSHTIGIPYSDLLCSITGAHDSKGTVALDNATMISGNSTPVETTLIVPTDTSGTSPTPTPIPAADFTVPLTSKSVTARSAVQSLDASTSTPTWIRQTAAPGWVSRICHSSVAMSDGTIVLMGDSGFGSTFVNDVWRSTDKGATWTQVYASSGWTERTYHTSVVGSVLPPHIQNMIYGLLLDDNTGAPISGATVHIRNATHYTTNLSLHYGGIDGVYWFDNLPANENYYLNATKLGYNIHVDVIVNTVTP